jgi:hypothetical protein
MIIVFDTATESFWQINSLIVKGKDTSLFEIGGMLGMSSLNDETATMDTWVMQDYKSEASAFKHRVQLPDAKRMTRLFVLSYGKLSVVVSSTHGDAFVLVQFGDD